jgi:hypothetical protein
MEQILAFVLGVSAVAFVWVVVVAFRTSNKVKNMESTIENIFHVIDRNDELVNRRIDQEIDRVDQIYRECTSHTNSRVDKLEQKLTSVDKDGCEPVKKKLLKG